MITNRTRQTLRISIVSTLFALIAFSFLIVGGASAHSISRTRSAAQALPVCTSNTIKMVPKRFGTGSKLVFNCNTMTVKVGTPVIFVNTIANPVFVTDNLHSFFLEVRQNSTASLPTTQAGQLNLVMYGRPYPQAALTVTVTA